MWLIWQFVAVIVIGIVVGWLAGQIVKGRGMGLFVDLLVGIAGSFLGWILSGPIFGLLGIVVYGFLGRLVIDVAGAVVLLVIVRAIKRS